MTESADAGARAANNHSAGSSGGTTTWRQLLGVFVRLTAQGPAFLLGVGALLMTAIAALVLLGLASDDTDAGVGALALVPGLAAQIATWVVGTTVVATAAGGAFARDGREGVRDLLALRGVPLHRYVLARIGSAALWCAASTASVPLLVALLALRSADGARASWTLLAGGAGAAVYCACFSAMLAALAFAVFAALPQRRPLLSLLGVIFLPTLLAPLSSLILPETWTSIPAALSALHTGLSPVAPNLRMALSGLLPLALVTIVALGFAVRALPRVIAEERGC